MESKYYTPSPEDIRIGFEYEFHGMTTGGLVFLGEDRSQDIEPSIKIWTPSIVAKDIPSTIFEGGQDYKTVQECLTRGQIRVPYLTKEQIEAEGWILTKTLEDEFSAQKHVSEYEFYDIDYDMFLHELTIEKFYQPELVAKQTGTYNSTAVFKGICKSINEFRKLMEMIAI